MKNWQIVLILIIIGLLGITGQWIDLHLPE